MQSAIYFVFRMKLNTLRIYIIDNLFGYDCMKGQDRLKDLKLNRAATEWRKEALCCKQEANMSIFPNILVLNDNFHSIKFSLEFLFYIHSFLSAHFFESICSLFSISISYYIPRRKEIFHLLQFQQLLPLKNQRICFL